MRAIKVVNVFSTLISSVLTFWWSETTKIRWTKDDGGRSDSPMVQMRLELTTSASLVTAL